MAQRRPKPEEHRNGLAARVCFLFGFFFFAQAKKSIATAVREPLLIGARRALNSAEAAGNPETRHFPRIHSSLSTVYTDKRHPDGLDYWLLAYRRDSLRIAGRRRANVQVSRVPGDNKKSSCIHRCRTIRGDYGAST